MTKQLWISSGMLFLFYAMLNSCGEATSGKPAAIALREFIAQADTGNTVASRFPPPPGFERIVVPENSFGHYLSSFPLKPPGSKVFYYNGIEKPNAEVYAAVLDIDVGSKDLQQCADAVMRLRAEYLFSQKQYDKIHFNFTNGFRAGYKKWAEGYRVKISGNSTSWFKSRGEDYSYQTFKGYLELVFSYAGTLSLSKEMRSIPPDSVRTGDVFIHGGSPGHAVLVMDVAADKSGRRIFLIAQSYMPAQSIHVLKNWNNKTISPWFDLSEADKLYSPEWTFEKSELKEFKD